MSSNRKPSVVGLALVALSLALSSLALPAAAQADGRKASRTPATPAFHAEARDAALSWWGGPVRRVAAPGPATTGATAGASTAPAPEDPAPGATPCTGCSLIGPYIDPNGGSSRG